MAFNVRVGRAVLELTAEGASYDTAIDKAKQNARELGGEWKKAAADLRTFSSQYQAAARNVSSLTEQFQGDRVIAQANHITTAVKNIGGVSKLTVAEMGRINAPLSEAIAKYTALGQVAPKAMVDLEMATRKAEQPTSFLSTKMVALGAAVGTFASQLAMQGIRTLVNWGREAFDAAGKITDLADATALSTTTIQRMQYVADQTDTTLEALSGSAFRLGVRLAGGSNSVKDGVDALRLSFAEIQRMRPDQQFDAIMAALGREQNQQERNRIGVLLFGKQFSEIAAAVQQGYADIAAGAEVSSEAQLRALDQASDRWSAFIRNTKTGVTSFLGEMLLMQDAIEEVSKSRGWMNGPPQDYGADYGQAYAEVVAEAQRRVQTGLMGGRKEDIALTEASTQAQATYAQQLQAVRAELDKLTTAQRREIDAAQQLGVSTDELEAKYGLSEGALKLLNAQTKDYEKSLKSSTAEAEKAREAQEAWHASYRTMIPTFSRWIQAGNDANVTVKDSLDLFRAMPAAITSAADSIEGRWIPAMHGVTALYEATARAREAQQELQDGGFLSAPPVIQSEDASGEAREIARTNTQKRLDVQRDQIVAFWKSQAATIENASLGRMGTLLFGNFGHDASGELKAAADKAHQEFLKIQRSGKATAEELTLAFERWREAEERAHVPFSHRWKTLMGGIKTTFVSVLDEMLQYFLSNFLKGIIKGLAGAKLGQHMASLFGGGGGGGGGIGGIGGGVANTFAARGITALAGGVGGGSLAAGTVSNGVLVGVGAGGGAGAAPAGAAAGAGGGIGGSFLTNPAFWTNPYTIGIIGGIILGTAIWKKGLFRGGWEGIEGNKRRDKHLAQWGPPGNGPESGRGQLAAFLAKKPGGDAILRDFSSGDKKRFEFAQQTIVTLAAQSGKKNIKEFRGGTPGLDFMEFGARTPAELHGQEAVIPRGSGHRLAGEIAQGLASLRMPTLRMPTFGLPTLRLPTLRPPVMGVPRLGSSVDPQPDGQESARNPQRERRALKAFNDGGFVPPGAEQHAVLHGGGEGELAAPIATLADMISDRFQTISQKGAALFGGPSAEFRSFISAQASLMTSMASGLKGLGGSLLSGFGGGGRRESPVVEGYEQRMGVLGGLVARMETSQGLMPAGAPGGGTGPIIVTVTNHNHFSGLVDKDSMDALYEEEIVPRTVRDIKFQLTGLGNAISRVRR